MTQATMFINGSIRNTENKLIGFYDRETGVLYINGITQEFKAIDEQHAMDLVGQYA